MTGDRPPEWDLSDPTGGRAVPARAPAALDVGGAAAAVCGAAAVAVAFAVQLGAVARWPLVAGLVVLTLLLALGALRRARRLSGVVLPALGACIAAVAVLTLAARPADPVDLGAVTVALPPSAAAAALPGALIAGSGDHVELRSSLGELLEEIHLVHGRSGPFPTSLELRPGGRVVVGAGWDRGAVLAVLPNGMRARYAVTPDARYFRITLIDGVDAGSTVTADSTMVAPTG